MFKKISITFVSKVINALLGLLNTILITQYLGADGKGVTALFTTSLGLCLLLCQIIGGNSLVFLSSRIQASALLFSSYLWATFVATTAAFILSSVGLCPHEYWIELAIVSALFGMFHTHLFILLGNEKTIAFNVLAPLPQLFQLFVALFVFQYLGNSSVDVFITYLYFVFGAAFLVSFAALMPSIQTFSLPDKYIFKIIWQYGSKAQLTNILFFLNNRLLFYLLGYFFLKADVGIYSVGVAIIESVLLISNSSSLMLYAKISNTKSRVKRLITVKEYLKISVGITTIALLVIVTLPIRFYILVFGDGFEQAHLVSLCLVPGAFFMSMYYVTSSYFSGIGKYQYNIISVLLGLIITFIGGVVFIPTGTIATAALVTSMAFTAIGLLNLALFVKEFKRKK
jgi:O-antigen/teichoic acid export membrane protein